jgi:hypothetical protein
MNRSLHKTTDIFISYSHADIDRIASLAARFRQALGLSSKEEFPIVDVLEFEISKVCKDFRLTVDLPANFDADVLATARFQPPEIVVRESVYQHAVVGSEPARVILAHELGHLWLAHGAEPAAEHIQIEWQADEFAAELLMPGDVISKMVADEFALELLMHSDMVSKKAADRIAKQFAVPSQSAKIRMEILEVRRQNSSKNNVPRFEPYTPLLSRFERDLLYWVPANQPSKASAKNIASGRINTGNNLRPRKKAPNQIRTI